MSDKRFALLIDSDNISAKYIDSILDEMTRHGWQRIDVFTVILLTTT